MKKQFVKDLAVRNKVNDIFYVRSRRVLEKRGGGKFIVLELSDKTGIIEGKIWDDVNDLFSESVPGNFVKIDGDVTEYMGDIQITITHILRISDKDVSSSDFIASSRFNIEDMYKELLGYFEKVKDKDFRKLLERMFSNNEFVKKFKSAPASTGIHHGYLGGLLEHTLFMLRFSRSIPEVYKELDYSLIVTGIILHDIGKINSYTYDKVIDHTDEGKLIYHIVEGYRIANDEIIKMPDFPEVKKQMVLHIILSHHGLREYGSPVTPKFAEAFIVHDIDNLDARMWMFRDTTEQNQDQRWSDKQWFLDTEVFIKPPIAD
jgi:3'-5' exoribonuclease